jgi:hypothetical protein
LGFYSIYLLRPPPPITFHHSVARQRFSPLHLFSPSTPVPSYRSLIFSLSEPPSAAILSLFSDFRLLTNLALRQALQESVTSRRALSRFVRDQAHLLHVNGSHSLSALQIALGLVAGHRRRLRLPGPPPRVPYLRRPFLRADDSTFHFDPVSGKLRLSLRRAEWASVTAVVSEYHRRVLADPTLTIKQLHLTSDRMILILEKAVPAPYAPTALLALDTNEGSLDGVTVGSEGTVPARLDFSEIPTLQHRHMERRRRLARRKATDRRLRRVLLGREGRREHDRVRSRLHVLSKQLVTVAAEHSAAVALEDLSKLPRRTRGAGGGLPGPVGASRAGREASSTDRSPTRRSLPGSRCSGSTPTSLHAPARNVA